MLSSTRDAAQSRLSKRADKTETFESRVRIVEKLAFGKANVATRATEALPSLGTGFETNVTYPQGTYNISTFGGVYQHQSFGM